MQRRYYWIREKNTKGEAIGDWEPALRGADGAWWTKSIPGWISDAECQKMFEIHPEPLQPPKP